ncbi:Holliday junction DNA helicase RuvA [Mycoplasmoides genitalium M6320]|uniref:Holliday junction branch migration complex subunit RuvA n=1 Tax=Mycoplasmoides genitalium M6320 TaxID=662945 RepID=A0ABC7ZJ73_MYCGT|nr:Holliday junction branch migration protein RuvA [Mycoplasmoides genitalium]AFQ04193.1 Holliday junction DNA helicase RuvA [Mycoplasmoides genitalium M6320]
MITSIFGKVTFVGKRKIIVEHNWISYWFNTKENHKFEKNLEKNKQIFCHIIKKIVANQIIEEAFAFNTLEEKEWFCRLIELNRIGSKTALNLLNNDLEEIKQYILENNYSALCGINGVNNKIARALLSLEIFEKSENNKNIKGVQVADGYDELFETLKSLGYKQQEIQDALKMIEVKPDFDISQLVAEVIKLMSFKNNEITNKTA